MMKIASWNVNSIKVRLPQVIEWLQSASPDVLVLQETKSIDDNFPYEAFESIGYQAVHSGQKTYNGVAIISRYPITEVELDIPQLDDPQRRILVATINGVRIMNVYVPNGQEVGSDKFTYKLNWLSAVTDYVKLQLAQYPEFVMLGDYNIAPGDLDVYNPDKWQGKILCSQPERDALGALVALGLKDSYRHLNPEANEFSWWDYRRGAFARNSGLRIDLILISDALMPKLSQAAIDINPRGNPQPSDHAPVYVYLDE